MKTATFLCIHHCISRGAVCKKGTIVTVPADALKLPENAALLSPASFTRLPDDDTAPAAPLPTATSTKTRDDLLARLAALKVTPPKKATVARLRDLLAEAADPDGAETP